MKNLQLLLICLSVTIPACQKKPPDIPVDANLKAAFNFQHGSYWIYRDTITGRVDSFAVSSNRSYSTNGAELLVIGVVDQSFSSTGIDTFSFDWNLYKRAVNVEFAKNGGFFQNTAGISYPLQATINSYSVYGINYSQVEEINDGNDSFYINSDVGVVKMILNHPNDNIVYAWELVRCKIVK